jgi:cytochrome c-type biogenesis protein CcmH/NrfG
MGGDMGGGGMGAAIGKVDEKELKTLQAKVEKDAKDVKSRERLGHLYLQMQDYDNVFKMAHEAIQADPKSLESRTHLGVAMNVMGEGEQGMAQLDKVLEADPKNLEALLFKGMIQLQGQDNEGAKATWTQYMKVAKSSDNGYKRVQMMLQSLSTESKTEQSP